MKTTEAVEKRVSTRTFINNSIDINKLKTIKDIIHSSKDHTIFGTSLKFDYMAIDASGNKDGKIGTYGMFSGHDGFIYGVCEDSKEGYTDFSYAMEYIILELTKIDIGSCWVAGTFNRKQFIQAIDKSDDQVLPAIAPIGLASDKLRFLEKIVKKIAKPRNRIPSNEMFFASDFKSVVEDNSVFKSALEMVRIGPSAVNKQPWRIIVENEICHLFDYKKDLKSAYKYKSLDIGIAAYHLKSSLEEQGVVGEFISEIPNNLKIPESMYYYCSFKILN